MAAQPKGNVSAADGDLLLLPLGGGEAVPYAEALAACRTAVLDSLPGGPNEAAWAASTSPILLYLPRWAPSIARLTRWCQTGSFVPSISLCNP